MRKLPVNSSQNDPRLFAFPSGEVPPLRLCRPRHRCAKKGRLRSSSLEGRANLEFSHIRADGSKKTAEKLGMVNSSHLKNDGNPEIMGIFQTPTELG